MLVLMLDYNIKDKHMKTFKNKIKFASGLFLVLMTLLSSCNTEEFLELEQPPEDPWKSTQDFEMAVVYPYNRAFFPGWGGGFTDSYDVLTEGLSDVLYLMDNAGESYPHDEVYYRQTDVDIDRSGGAFSYAYDGINNIIAALSFANEPEQWTSAGKVHPFEGLNETEQKNLDRQLGELYFMKAFTYYYLVCNHAPPPGSDAFNTEVLPFKNEWNIDPAVQQFPEYASAKKIYDEIILVDLKKAIELLPWQSRDGIDHQSYGFGRATKYTAIGLASRVFMSLAAEDNSYWQRIVDLFEGNDLITANVTDFIPLDVATGSWGIYNLSASYQDAFIRNDKEFVSDAIWSALYYDDNLGPTPKEKTLLTWNKYSALQSNPADRDSSELRSNRCSWHVFSLANTVAEKLGWIYYDTDTTFKIKEGDPEYDDDERVQQAVIITRKKPEGISERILAADTITIWELRYPNEDRSFNLWIHKYFRGPVGDYTNIPVMKLSEMILNYSIAANEASDPGKALSGVNTIRNARGLNNVSPPAVADSVFKYFDREYIKETMGEGHRLRLLLALKGKYFNGDVIPQGDKRYVDQTDGPKEDPKASDDAYKIRRAAVSWNQVKMGVPGVPNDASGGAVKLYWPVPINELIFKQ
jgi:hypothetical protein